MYAKMRRFVALLLFVALLMAMAACGAKQGPGQPGAASTRTPIVQEETPTLLPSPTPTSCSTTPTAAPTPTPTGRFSVLAKARGITFTSPWPIGSPYYYEPTYINYALLFKAGGFYLHDAWWHVKFGPGSNVPHQLPNGSWETGSHGCVGMPIPDAKRLYEWTPVGTPVIIRG